MQNLKVDKYNYCVIVKLHYLLSGDLLGSTLNGIDDLLRMSYGCGEQNLVGFSTNVYVTTYLKATGRLTNALKEKSEKILATGKNGSVF